MSLSDEAQRRLVHYCRRAAISPPEYVERDAIRGPRQVRYVNKQLRALVWADEEVRDALLVDDNFQPLVEVLKSHRCPGGFDRLDLMAAMTLEHEMVCRETPISSAVSPAS